MSFRDVFFEGFLGAVDDRQFSLCVVEGWGFCCPLVIRDMQGTHSCLVNNRQKQPQPPQTFKQVCIFLLSHVNFSCRTMEKAEKILHKLSPEYPKWKEEKASGEEAQRTT